MPVRVVASLLIVAAFGGGILTSASGSSAARARCAAGSVRWLERWDVAYAGRVLRPTQVYRAPGGAPLQTLAVADDYGFPTTIPIVAERLASNCHPTWFRVRVRSYPNGQLGWLRAGTIATSRIRKRILVDVSQHRLVLYKRGKLVLKTPAAVGKPGTPTPIGRFYITQRFILTDSHGPYGSRALGISAFSNVLRTWRDGGPIGIHGTNEPFSIGQAVSHGCIRLPDKAMIRLFKQVPLATPVVIRP
jgi:lipoprotein-anchoring transpeptidase ErfK/SrfK